MAMASQWRNRLAKVIDDDSAGAFPASELGGLAFNAKSVLRSTDG